MAAVSGRLARPRGKDGTVRDQLNVLVKRSNGRVMPPLLQEESDLLEELEEAGAVFILEDWRDATRNRGSGLGGVERLSHSGMRAWLQNRRIEVTDWQITAMMEFDSVFIAELTVQTEEEDGSS